MRRRVLLFGILLLLMLILILPFIVSLFQQETQRREQVLSATSFPFQRPTQGRGQKRGVTPSPSQQPTQEGGQVPGTTWSPYPANIDFEPMNSYGTYNPAALDNPNIEAVDINMNWINVEPQQGVFNWRPADNEIAAWAGQGKKFTLIVRYIKEGTSGTDCSSQQLMPAWEIARIQNFCDSDMGTLIPDYFDPTFKADLEAYVQALATHYANSPYRNNLLYVRIGLGEGGEGFPIRFKGDYYTTDAQQLATWGYTPSSWAKWQEEMLASYKSSFWYTRVIYPLNGQDTDPTTGQPVQIEVAMWAAANGFGVGQQGLQPGTNSPIFQQLRSQYPEIYIQYQTFEAVRTFAGIQADIQAADKNGAQFIEWYSQDAVNPAYQPLFAQWQQRVDNKFVGGGTGNSDR